MTSPGPKFPFVKVPMEVDAEATAESSSSLRSRIRGRHLALAFVVALSVSCGTFMALRRGGQKDSREALAVADTFHTIEAVAKPFQQCGGDGWMGSTCCQKGCACTIKTRYYSMCATPSKTGKCNVEAARDEVEMAKSRAREAKNKIEKAETSSKELVKKVKPLREAYEKAMEPVKKVEEAGSVAKKAWDLAHEALKMAQAAAAKADKEADDAAKEHSAVVEKLDPFDKAEDMNKGGQCGDLGAQCGGVSDPAKACCVIGCMCEWKNKYWGACVPPKGKPTCDEAGYREEEEELRSKEKELKALKEKTAAAKKDAAEAVAKAEVENAKTRKVAIAKGTVRARTEKHAREAKKAYEDAKKAYHKAHADATHAVHNVKYLAAMVKVWKKVADGDACSELDASEVLAADPVDFEAITIAPKVKETQSAEFSEEDSKQEKELDDLDDDLDLDDEDLELDA